MAQHDYNIANGSGAAVRSDVNDALSAVVTRNSGATAPATTFARMLWADTTAGVLKRRNAANSGWIVEVTDDETFVLTRSTNTILDVSDIGKTIKATASFTQTLDAVATLTDGWAVGYIVDSGATITVDANASELIDGATTKSLVGPTSGFIVCNGAALFTIGFAGSTAAASDTASGVIELAVQSEMETGTDVVRAVVPGRQHFHPGHPKFWGYVTWSGGTPTLQTSYNVTSITDTSVGVLTVTIANDFSTANWSTWASVESSSTNFFAPRITSKAAGSFIINLTNAGGSLADPDACSFGGCGDL